MAEPLAVRVRLEHPGDLAEVDRIERAAFGGPDEARIVELSRRAPDWDPARSIVAERDDGTLVGHLLLSPCPVHGSDGAVVGSVVAIGPVAVEPGHQRRGVGSALMRAAITSPVAAAAPALVLLGHPSYYPRFGFLPARRSGLLPPRDWPDAAWLALRMPAWTDTLRGTVSYPDAFEPL